jgi:hypothetical protein
VQRQLQAYKRARPEALPPTFADDITIYRLPATQRPSRTRPGFAKTYRQRFASPNLHAEILYAHRDGNKVIDHERIAGIREQPLEAARGL